MNEIRRPKVKAKREVRRSKIALDDYLFDRKMQSLYYGNKPKSDDLPQLLKLIRRYWRVLRTFVRTLPRRARRWPTALKKTVKANPVQSLAAGLLAAILVVFVAPQVLRSSPKTPAAQPIGKSGEVKDVATSKIPINQTPEFSVVLPQGKTAKDVGGFAKVSPTGAPAAYTYKDKIGDIEILVTEQLLPDSMKKETAKEVEKLAIGYNATQSVKTEKSEFFIGTNTNGQQSVITFTKTLLLLIKSTNKITNERWQTYIESLR